MNLTDKIIFGDNQFFGINHMSQEKAQKMSEKFYDIDEIFKIYNIALDNGVDAFMLNTNDRAKLICENFKKINLSNDTKWYASIPYPHKYANMISEKGIRASINDILLKNHSISGVISMVAKGGSAVLTKDIIKLMQILIDIEMKTFYGMNVKVIFLQNIVTDLLLGFNIADIFYEYKKYIEKKYKAVPGFITQNLPQLKKNLEKWDIKNVAICSSFNKIGYLMSPNLKIFKP